LTVRITDALLRRMRQGVGLVVVSLLALFAVTSTGCRTQESRVCDAHRADLLAAIDALHATAAKPDDLQKHRDLRDKLGALSKRIEANRIPRLDTEDASELTMRALEKMVVVEVNVIDALDPNAEHPLSAAQYADIQNGEARTELLKAVAALRAQCER
jgi:hypothetical protein